MAEPHRQFGDAAAVQDLTGTTVGRFAIRARLGAGGMGEVYRAEDTKLKRPVALKRMAGQLRSDPYYRRRFLKEAERASALSDSHIAGVYDVLEENEEIFLVMEYVEGETLRQRLGRPLEVKQFLPIAIQCAEALAAAHAREVVHRDIKPENIMLTPAGQVKILDFGVAKRLPRADESGATESTAGALSGTPAYMAPEVLLEKEADGRADIFSLGVVFYEALTGRHPFRAGGYLATTDRILHETPSPLRQLNPVVPVELEGIVERMLSKEPDERYLTAADLLAHLRALQAPAAYPGLHATLSRVLKGRRARRWQVVALVVILAFATVLLWRLVGPEPVPPERIPIAVLPFVNQTGDERLEAYRLTLTQMLLLDLTGSPNMRVFPYERLLEIIRGFEAEGKDISSPEAIQAVAAFSNSRFMVVPSMFAVGNTVRVQAELREAGTGEAVSTVKVERALSGSAEDTLYSMLGELGEGIQKYFKKVGRGEDYQPRPDASRPKTATAALHLNEGRKAFAQGNYAQALNSFQRVVEQDPEFALPYAWMGQIYGLLGYDDRAREFSEKAAQRIKADTPLIDAYFVQANLGERQYDYAAAETNYRELIRLYPDDPVWHAGLAGVFEKQGQYPKAIASLQEALRRDPNYIVAYQQLGVLYSRTDELPQALSHAQKALSLYRALGNPEGEASALVVLGEVYRLKADYQQAKDAARSALQLFQDLGNEFGILWARKLLGDIRFTEGDYREARHYYQQVLSTSGQIRNNRQVTLALMNMGVAYSREGNLAKAVESYERSLAQGQLYGQYKDWPSLRGRAMTLHNLGAILMEYGPEPDRGLQLVQEALPIFEMMSSTGWIARSWALLGLYYMNAGRHEEALGHLQRAQAAFRSIEDKERLAHATYRIGRCYFLQNQYERALGSFADALALAQNAQDSFRAADSQVSLGRTYFRLGDAAQARALIEEGLQAAKKNGYGEILPDAFNALGELQWEGGEKEQARQSFQEASALGKEPYVSEFSIEARSNLGVLEAEGGNSERALSDCQASVTAARRLAHRHTLARALLNLARVYVLRKEYRKAIEALDEVTSQGESSLGLELRAQAFYLRSQALAGLGKTEEAKAAYLEGQAAIRKLQETLTPRHRESFGERRDIQVLLPREEVPAMRR